MNHPGKIQLHPNGFIQYELPNDCRLHIWSGLNPQAQKVHTPIHDHTFDFESTVLLGTLEHRTYALSTGFGIEPTHTAHEVRGDYLISNGFNCRAEQTQLMRFAPGTHYTFQHGLVHASHGCNLTATVMRRVGLWERPYRRAVVLVPVGVEPDNEFRRDQYSADLLMEGVSRVKTELFGTPYATDMQLVAMAGFQ